MKSSFRSLCSVAVLSAAMLAGCEADLLNNGQPSADPRSPITASHDLPCDVGEVLVTYCLSCHSLDPPGDLSTAADLAEASATTPSLSKAEESLARLASTDSDHMPPRSVRQPSAEEIAVLENWIVGGMLAATCATPATTVPPVAGCTSGSYWTGGNRESPLMRPGGACIDCHTGEGEGPIFTFAGTVFETPYELDDCNGAGPEIAPDVQVVVTDAEGNVTFVTPNEAGNFSSQVRSFATPYTAKIRYDGREIEMLTPQEEGDCNTCHTETGSSGALGRIFLP